MWRISFQLAAVALSFLQSGKADRGKLQPGAIGTTADAASPSLARHGKSADSNLSSAAALQVGAEGRASLHREATTARGRRRKDDEGTMATPMKLETDQRTAIGSEKKTVSDERAADDGTSLSMKHSDLVQLSLLLEEKHKVMIEELAALKAKVDDHGEQVAFVKKMVQRKQMTTSQEVESPATDSTLADAYRVLQKATASNKPDAIPSEQEGSAHSKVLENQLRVDSLLELKLEDVRDADQQRTDQNNPDDPPLLGDAGGENKRLNLLSTAQRRKVHNEMLLSDRKGKALLAITDALKMKYYSAALKMEVPLEDVQVSASGSKPQFDARGFRLGYADFASPVFSSMSSEEFAVLKGLFKMHIDSGVALGAAQFSQLLEFAGISYNTMKGSASTINRLIMECVGTVHQLPAETAIDKGLTGENQMKITFPEFARCLLPDMMLMHLRI